MDDFRWTGFDEANPAHLSLQGFLVLDVQDQPELAEELATEIRAYLANEGEACEGCGNGYEYECTPEGFYLECMYEGDDLSPVTVDYPTVLAALAEWSERAE